MRDFFLLPFSTPLSLSAEYVPHLWALWWCFSAQNGFTSTKTSLLYLYFTTPLGNHASWAAELWAERGRESKRGGGQVRKREEGMKDDGGGGMMQIISKTEKSIAKDRQVNKERGKQSEEEWRWRANEIGGKAQVRQRSGKRGVEKAPWNGDNMITLLKGKHRNGLMKRHSYTHTHPYRHAIQNQRPLVSGDEGRTEGHGFERKQRGPVIERKGRYKVQWWGERRSGQDDRGICLSGWTVCKHIGYTTNIKLEGNREENKVMVCNCIPLLYSPFLP